MKNVYSDRDEFLHDLVSEILDLYNPAEPHATTTQKPDTETKATTIKEQMDAYYASLNKSKEKKNTTDKRHSRSEDLDTNNIAAHKQAKEDYLARTAASFSNKNNTSTSVTNKVYNGEKSIHNNTFSTPVANMQFYNEVKNPFPTEKIPMNFDPIKDGYDLDEGDLPMEEDYDTSFKNLRHNIGMYLSKKLPETAGALNTMCEKDTIFETLDEILSDEVIDYYINIVEKYFKTYNTLTETFGKNFADKVLGVNGSLDTVDKLFKKYF